MAEADDEVVLSRLEKFPTSSYNDPVFGVIFLANVAGVIAWIGYCASSGVYSEMAKGGTTTAAPATATSSPDIAEIGLFLKVVLPAACALAIGSSVAWLGLLQAAPELMVKASLLGMPLIMLGLAVATQNLIIGIVALLSFAWAYWMWQYVEFTAKLFKTVSTVYQAAAAIYAFAVGIIVLQVVTQILYVLAGAPLNQAGEQNGGVMVFLLLSFYWTVNVLKFLLHVTCCGVIARWYFNHQVETSVTSSAGAACTSYFGSICLGSLLIAIIQTIKAIVQNAAQAKDDNAAAQVLKCVALCVLNCIEYIAEFFTTYTFVIVSIYGLPFMKAGQATYRLMQDGGIEVLRNYQLTGTVTMFGTIAAGAFTAGGSCLVAMSFGMGQQLMVLGAVVGFLAGFCTMCMVSAVVESGVECLFVCFIKEPLALQKARPELYDAFCERSRMS